MELREDLKYAVMPIGKDQRINSVAAAGDSSRETIKSDEHHGICPSFL